MKSTHGHKSLAIRLFKHRAREVVIISEEMVLELQGKVMSPMTMVGVTRLLVVTALQCSQMRGRILN